MVYAMTDGGLVKIFGNFSRDFSCSQSWMYPAYFYKKGQSVNFSFNFEGM